MNGKINNPLIKELKVSFSFLHLNGNLEWKFHILTAFTSGEIRHRLQGDRRLNGLFITPYRDVEMTERIYGTQNCFIGGRKENKIVGPGYFDYHSRKIILRPNTQSYITLHVRRLNF